mgnify:CR=1 FL=1
MSNIMVGQIPSNYGTGAGTIVMDMEEYIRLAEKPLSMSELKAKWTATITNHWIKKNIFFLNIFKYF